MIKKKEIIQYLKSQGFEKQDNHIDCLNKSFYVNVPHRNKNSWEFIFFNKMNNQTLTLHAYWITVKYKDGNSCSCKLNTINEFFIDNIIKSFLSTNEE